MAPQPAIQALLSVRKKKGLEKRFFALFDEHLAYYRSEEDFGGGGEPRGRVGLEDISAVRVESGGFTLVLGQQELEVVVDDQATLKAWVKQLKKFMPGKVEQEGAEEEGDDDKEEEEEEDDDDEDGEGEDEQEEAEEDEKKGSENGKSEEEKTSGAKKPMDPEETKSATSSKSGGAKIKVELVKDGVPQEAHLELNKNTLIVHEIKSDVGSGGDPLKLDVAKIERLDRVEGGFDLGVGGLADALKCRVADGAELDAWLARLQEAQKKFSDNKAGAGVAMDRAGESNLGDEVEGHGISELELEPEWVTLYMKDGNLKLWTKKKKGMFSSKWTCCGCGITNKGKLKHHMHYQDKKNKKVLDACELCFSRHLPTPPGAQQALCTGIFFVKDGKKKTTEFFAALTSESIVEYKTMHEYIGGKRPQSWRHLEGTKGVSVSDDCIVTHKVDGKPDFKMQVGILFADEARQKLAMVWGRKLGLALAPQEITVQWGSELSTKLPPAPKARAVKAEPTVKPTESVTPRAHTARYAGPVSIEGEEVEHALLRQDKFMVFESNAVELKGASPRTAVTLDEVTGIRTWDAGFQFEMADNSTLKVFVAPGTLQEWVDALKDVVKIAEEDIPAPMVCRRFAEEGSDAEGDKSQRPSLSAGSDRVAPKELEVAPEPPRDPPLIEGPLIVVDEEDPAECYAMLTATQLDIAPEKGREVESSLDCTEIRDVVVEGDIFALTFVDGSTFGFRVPKTSPVTLDDWCEVLLVVCGDVLAGDDCDRVMTALTYRGTSVDTVPYDEKKLREVYDLCQDDDGDGVTKDSLFHACRERKLIADFFGIEEDPEKGGKGGKGGEVEKGLEVMEVILEALQIGRAAAAGSISWPEFKRFHERWEARRQAMQGSERLVTQLRRWSTEGAPRWEGPQPTKTRFVRNSRLQELMVRPKHRKEPNVAKRKTIFSQRALITKKGFCFNTHKDAHQAYSSTHGVSKIYELQRPLKTAVDPKINMPCASLERRRGSAPVAQKITSPARTPNYQSSVDDTPWQKINHIDHAPRDKAAVPGGEQPGRCRRASVTRKVNEKRVGKEGPKRCASVPGGFKIGEKSRAPLARERGRRREPSPKVTDHQTPMTHREEVHKSFHSGSVHKMRPLGH